MPSKFTFELPTTFSDGVTPLPREQIKEVIFQVGSKSGNYDIEAIDDTPDDGVAEFPTELLNSPGPKFARAAVVINPRYPSDKDTMSDWTEELTWDQPDLKPGKLVGFSVA